MESHFQEELYRSYLMVLARVQLAQAGRVRYKLDASDLVQEVLLKALANREQFRGDTPEEFAAWLQRILANTLLDAGRRYGRKKRAAALEQEYRESLDATVSRMLALPGRVRASPTQDLLNRELSLLLGNALETLPEDQRTAVELRHLAEWSLADICEHMNRTRPAVAGLLRRGLKGLRGSLGTLE